MKIGAVNNSRDARTQAFDRNYTGVSDVFKRTLDKALQDKNDKKLRESCQELESIMLFQMIRAMRDTVPKDGILGESFGGEVFESMLDEEYSRQMARRGTTGLADLLYQQLKTTAQQPSSAGVSADPHEPRKNP